MGSIAISANGKIIYQRSIGYSAINGDNKIAANTKTKYRIGSISKMFTATIIFQLVEEGKLRLDSYLSTWFPQMPNAGRITIGEMLNHHSGLHNFNNDSLYFTYATMPQSEAAMLARMQSEKPDFEPGAKAEYSNTNFLLLGYIVEKITGKPYAEELRARITAKIGLADTYYGEKTDTAKNEAYSYIFAGGWRQQSETDMSIPGGAGALVSTPTDLVKFIECLFNGKLISQVSVDEMTTMHDNYGMAMFMMPFKDKKGFGHNGGIDGFTSILSYFPNQKLAVAYITNGGAYSINDVRNGALNICFNQPFELPSSRSFTLKPEQLDKYLGTYVCTQIPLKVTIIKSGNMLIAQYGGLKELALDPVGVDQFLIGSEETTVFFNTDRNEFTAMQGGERYLYTRVK